MGYISFKDAHTTMYAHRHDVDEKSLVKPFNSCSAVL